MRSPLFSLLAVAFLLLSGCIVQPRRLCGPGNCATVSPCPPPGLHHPVLHCPQVRIEAQGGSTVGVTPWPGTEGSAPE